MEDAFGLARPVATRVGVPIVVRLHGPWFLTGKWANDVGRDRASERRDRNEKLGIISAAGVSAPSRDVLDRCRHHFGLELANAEIIPNPIPPVTADERWSVNRCDQSRILFVGRFDRLKGGDLVIDAFRNLQLNKPNVQLTFIGQDRGVFTSDGTYCRLDEYLRSTVPSAAARQRFEWAGAVPHSKIAKFRRSAMVTVVASRYENFPYSLTEAMAQGCPVVAANVGGMREIVQHGENGLLFRPGDAKDLAAKIETLLDAPALAQRLGRQAVLDCHERYRPEIVANQMLGFYTRVLRRWDSGRV
jgi:glycosyltransferase involved in cell wall biosynthesis